MANGNYFTAVDTSLDVEKVHGDKPKLTIKKTDVVAVEENCPDEAAKGKKEEESIFEEKLMCEESLKKTAMSCDECNEWSCETGGENWSAK